MKDSYLEREIRQALALPSGKLTPARLLPLTAFEAHYKFISNIAGLENARNLQRLVLSFNRIKDLAPLASLDRLEYLDLSSNEIEDVTSLQFLQNLTWLDLHDNHLFHVDGLAKLTHLKVLNLSQNVITDLHPLAGLQSLQRLILGGYTDNPIGSHTAELYGNPYWEEIEDITPLAPLTNLEILWIADHGLSSLEPLRPMKKLRELMLTCPSRGKGVRNIDPLEDLTALRVVHLEYNSIEDLTPLVRNAHFCDGAELYVNANPLSEEARLAHIPALENRGVKVQSVTPPSKSRPKKQTRKRKGAPRKK